MADDEMVAWLSATLDAMEQAALAVVHDQTPWHESIGRSDADGDDRLMLALCDPRGLLARVDAERRLLHVHVPDRDDSVRGDPMCVCCSDTIDYGGMAVGEWPCETVRLLAYGYRFDAPGYRGDEWAPGA